MEAPKEHVYLRNHVALVKTSAPREGCERLVHRSCIDLSYTGDQRTLWIKIPHLDTDTEKSGGIFTRQEPIQYFDKGVRDLKLRQHH